MRAAALTTFGGPEVLREMDVPTPTVKADEVRVRVKAAGVQPYDLAVRAGWTPPGVSPDFPRVPGNEFAGVIDQVGADVAGAAEGAEVLGFGQLGAYAEYIVVPASHVTPKPESMPWEVAGGLTSGAQTAHIALEMLDPHPGATVLIHGAAGSVGTAAVQLARLRGLTVIGTARSTNHDYLRELGAIPVAYGDGLVDRVRELAPDGVDFALDGAGGEAFEASLKLVADPANVMTFVEHGKAAGVGARTTENRRSAARLAEVAHHYATGLFTWHVRSTYPLADAAQAHRDLEKGHGRGKIVLSID